MTDLTEGNELKTILYFSVPIFLGNIFEQLYNVTDAAIVGNFIGTEGLAAVGAGAQIVTLTVFLSTGISIGASVFISRLYGSKQFEDMKEVLDTNLIFTVLLAFILTVLGIRCSTIFLKWLSVPPSLLSDADTYLKIIFSGLVPLFAYNTLANSLRGVGDSKTPTYILISSVCLNAFLDIIFIAVFRYGTAGAAIATVLAQLFSFITCLLYMNRKYPELALHIFHLKWNPRKLCSSLAVGIPAMLQQTFIGFGFLVIQFLVNSFGTTAIAAYTAASKVDTIAEMPAVNLGQALMNFTAQNNGAGKPERIQKGGKNTLVLSVIISVCTSIIVYIFSPLFISIFDRNAAVIQIGRQYLHIVSVFYLIFGAMQVLNGLLLGYGKSVLPLIASITTFCLLQVPLAVLLSRTSLGFNGIWLATPFGWTAGFLMRLIYFRHISKK